MSIWVNKNSKVIVQGITGRSAMFHTEQMLKYGTNIVAGVTPNKGGEIIHGIHVYESVKEAKEKTDANVSVIYVPAPYAKDAILEAVDAEIELIVCITEHIPILDMLIVKDYLKGKKSRLIGPNCPGIITPDECKIGIMPGFIHNKGRVGIVSRSGTLTYEAVNIISKVGLGQSTAIGIGGDPINGTDFIDVLREFKNDNQTEVIVLIGEIGGNAEEKAAKWIKDNLDKPVIAFISGKTAPKGKRMGHAGAIVSQNSGSYESKAKAFKDNNILLAKTIEEIGELVKSKI